MEIINKTKWSKRDLRKLIIATLKFSGQIKPRTIYIYGRKSNYITGLAPVNTHAWVKLRIPQPNNMPFPNQQFAQVLIHEVNHNEGLYHKEMCNSNHIHIPNNILSIIVNPTKLKPKTDIIFIRKNHALFMLEKSKKKYFRLEKIIRKWEKKVKYYEDTDK